VADCRCSTKEKAKQAKEKYNKFSYKKFKK
jgi:hypothetical protein